MRIPTATFRVQFNKDFQFKDAEALLPYLEALGVSHLYASPIVQARKGSTHGYDVTDPSQLNVELGTPQEFESLVSRLHELGMGMLLDIVPNHMAASPENPWWMDVLENGPASRYSAYFDVEWGHRTPAVQQKIILPILGEPYGIALEGKKLQLSLEEGGFRVNYYETKLPLDPASYHDLLSHRLSEFLRETQGDYPGLADFGLLLERAERIPARTNNDWELIEARHREVPDFKQSLWDLYSRYQRIREFIDENIRIFDGTEGDPASFDLLDALLNKQAYQVSFWKVAREKINYRRFFDVNDLIGIRAQDPQVFEGTHELTLRLLAEGKIDSLRIDHIDGLYDPLAYLSHLQARVSAEAGGQVYVAVEKILSGSERLPAEWPVAGTSGYDFLGINNNLFVHPEGLKELGNIYNRFTKTETSFYEVAYSQKRRMVQVIFAGETGGLRFRLGLLAETDRYARDLSPAELGEALMEVTASLPVYRTYTRDFAVSETDREYIHNAVCNARKRNPKITGACFDFLERVLLLQRANNDDDLRFVMRWQQFTGPVMAKGVEDTTLYQYHRLISMNEVGGSPLPVSTEEFHAFQEHRRQYWPVTMNASSTHDTKRSEDVRARLNLLSENPRDWEKHVSRWTRWNRPKKTKLEGVLAPDENDEYLLYQTLVGAWPLSPQDEPSFRDRVKAYMRKAVRESKRHSSWLSTNGPYEDAIDTFIDSILAEHEQNPFLESFHRFHKRIAFYGAVNSLSQTLLKIGCPGVPDFYQGTTLWDFSLVDPDNRRPTEIPERLNLLEEMAGWDMTQLLENWRDGRVKSFLILKALQFRKEHASLFERGKYIPLRAEGRAAEHTLSFARCLGDEWAVVVVPRFATGFSALEKWPAGRRIWGDAAVTPPENAPTRWTNVLTGETVESLAIADVLRTFPVGMLYGAR